VISWFAERDSIVTFRKRFSQNIANFLVGIASSSDQISTVADTWGEGRLVMGEGEVLDWNKQLCRQRWRWSLSLTLTSTLICRASGGTGALFWEVRNALYSNSLEVFRSSILSMLCLKGPYTAGGLRTTNSKLGL
jgi:hypothetical protein